MESTHERNTSFTSYLKQKISRQKQMVLEDDWIIFLQDHKEIIKENSTWEELTEATMKRYQYRIRDFLLDRKHQFGMEQAFRVVNRLHSDMDFVMGLDGVWIPNDKYITELRDQYYTNKQLEATRK